MFPLITGLISAACKIAGTVVKLIVNLDVLKLVGKVFLAIGQALGIIPPEKEMEEVGDQALQAEESGIKPENFKSYEEYKKAVESYKTDPEKSKQYSPEQKIQKAIEFEAAALLSKYPNLPVEDIFTTVVQNYKYFTPERVASLGPIIKDNVEFLGDVAHYMQGKEKNLDKIDSTVDILTQIEKKLNPTISDADAQKIVLDSKI